VSGKRFEQIEFGEDLPELRPDVSMGAVRRFAKLSGMMAARFTDHEGARKEGLPGAIVPGIMSQGLLASMIHRWAEPAHIEKIDTVFRAPILVDSAPRCKGVVTHVELDARTVEIDLTIETEAGETRVLGTAVVRL
jgi:hypothetical protein